jgi:hypothetical protein
MREPHGGAVSRARADRDAANPRDARELWCRTVAVGEIADLLTQDKLGS